MKKIIKVCETQFAYLNIKGGNLLKLRLRGQGSGFKEGPDMVRASMLNVAKTIKNCEIIETSTDRSWSDYPKHTDNTHYNTVGQVRLGKAMAEKMLLINN